MNQLTKDQHAPYRVRPRFKVSTSDSVNELTEKIEASLKMKDAPCKGLISEGYGTLSLPYEEQHYWSPQLTLTIEETENGSLLRGLYGPRPAVWSMFVFFYAVIGLGTLIIGMVGLSHLWLDKSATILWFVPLLLLVMLTLYLVAYSGQKIGREQMATLHRFLEESTGLDI